MEKKSNVVIDLYVGGEARFFVVVDVDVVVWYERARENDKQLNSSFGSCTSFLYKLKRIYLKTICMFFCKNMKF